MNNETHLSDFYSAVILRTLGYPLIRLDRVDHKIVTFVFSDPNKTAQDALKQYWDRQLTVKARDLIDNIGELKTRIHSPSQNI